MEQQLEIDTHTADTGDFMCEDANVDNCRYAYALQEKITKPILRARDRLLLSMPECVCSDRAQHQVVLEM